MNNPDLEFAAGFTGTLLHNCASASCPRDAIRAASSYHWDMLALTERLEALEGDIDKIIDFFTREWGWVISYDADVGVLIADENKPECVCPVARATHADASLCACSEGFAERLFTAALRRPVRSEVISSILRGGAHCVYKITIL